MRTFDTILYEEADGVAWVTLNRPQRRNAFTYPMCLELQEVWTTLRHRDEVRVVVLTATGDDAFVQASTAPRYVPIGPRTTQQKARLIPRPPTS